MAIVQSEPETHRFELRVLGPCMVSSGSTPLDLDRWPKKAASLLRLLAVVQDRRMGRDEAIELLWPEAAPAAGISSLKNLLHRLRRAMAAEGLPAPIVLDHGWVQLNPDCVWNIDVDRLVELAERAGEDADLLAEAAGLLQGEPLAEDRYQDWAIPVREHLQQIWRDLCLRLLQDREGRGDPREVLQWSSRLLAVDPLDETAVQYRLRALVQLGRRPDARQEFQRFALRLQEELGVEPAAETRGPLTPAGNLPHPVSSFIGRREDMASVLELLGRAEVRLLTLTGPGGVGKTRLAVEVGRRLQNVFLDGVFLVRLAPVSDATLVPAAIASALDVREEAGVSLTDAIEAAIGEKELLLVVDNLEHVLEAGPLLTELLAACPNLKVLATSRERLHLTGEQRFDVPPLALPAGSVSIEALGAYDAIALFVGRAQRLDHRFRLTTENGPAIVAICTRLDGLPLAIELAAARLFELSPAMMLRALTASTEKASLELASAGFRDLPARQRTLYATIAWSYGLLSGWERLLFRRLAVCAGGWTAGLAEQLCGGAGRVVEGLESLADKSLVRDRGEVGGERRFAMLQTIREYGLEQLAAAEEETLVRRRHAEAMVQLAECAESEMGGSHQRTWFQRFEADRDNIRAAIRWAITVRDASLAFRLTSALYLFWDGRGLRTEARQWLQEALALDTQSDPLDRAHALQTAAHLARRQGDGHEAMQLYERSLAILREVDQPLPPASTLLGETLLALGTLCSAFGDTRRAKELLQEALGLMRRDENTDLVATALDGLGTAAIDEGDLASAWSYVAEARNLYVECRSERSISEMYLCLGYIRFLQGQYDAARHLTEEGLARYRELTNKRGTCHGLLGLGRVLSSLGEPCGALAALTDGLEIADELGDRWAVAEGLSSVAELQTTLGWFEKAVQAWAASEAHGEAVGFPRPRPEQERHERLVETVRSAIGEAAWKAAWQAGRVMTWQHVLEMAEGRVKAGYQGATPGTKTQPASGAGAGSEVQGAEA